MHLGFGPRCFVVKKLRQQVQEVGANNYLGVMLLRANTEKNVRDHYRCDFR